MKGSNKIYDNLINLTEPYLGPSSERFIDRQIRHHLNKEPHKVRSNDIPQLINWIKLSMALLTEDKTLINNYIRSIKSLYRA
jgi:hypothetical protein